MTSWLSPIKRILEAETGDLRKLAEVVGANPTIFYVGQNLSDCDLRGQDLRGMDFSGAILDPRSMDLTTKIDAMFDPRFKAQSHYIQIGVHEEVLASAYAFADKVNYRYKAWALKGLLETGVKNVRNKEIQHIVNSNPSLKDLIGRTRGKIRRLTLNVYPSIQESVHDLAFHEGREYGKNDYNEVILAGLIRQYINHHRAASFSSIKPLEMFGGAEKYLRDIRRGKRFVG